MNSYVDSFREYLTLELGYSIRTSKTYVEALKDFFKGTSLFFFECI